MAHICVYYAYHEYNSRVEYFIKNAIFESSEVDFVVVCNNTTDRLELPAYVKYIQRENIGLDFGAWSIGLLTDDQYKTYESFIFINSSVVGPFLPIDYSDRWVYRFLSPLDTNEIHLSGSTINSWKDPKTLAHVQSYAFCMKKKALEVLIQNKIFSLEIFASSMQDAIHNYEVRMSRVIINNGWNIGSLMTYYKDLDWTFKIKPFTTFPKKFWIGSVFSPKSYINKTTIPHREVMFMKGNRFPAGHVFE